MHDAFFEEIEEFEACSSQIRGTSGTSTDEHEIRLQSWLGQVDEQIEKCVKVKGGISRQYIYRSLYAPQLFHCFKVKNNVIMSLSYFLLTVYGSLCLCSTLIKINFSFLPVSHLRMI